MQDIEDNDEMREPVKIFLEIETQLASNQHCGSRKPTYNLRKFFAGKFDFFIREYFPKGCFNVADLQAVIDQLNKSPRKSA